MTGAGPSRRSHTKSRTGCKTCKRRHIRCDELYPQCRNCTKHQVRCDYMDAADSDIASQRSSIDERSVTVSTSAEDEIDRWKQTGIFPFPQLNVYPVPQAFDLTKDELRLIHHLCSVTNDLMLADVSNLTIWTDKIPKFLGIASGYPFVMHALLSFGANHLAWTQTSTDLRNLQVQHGGVALRGLHEALGNFSPNNADAILAASMLMCWQATDWASYSSLLSGIHSVLSIMPPQQRDHFLNDVFPGELQSLSALAPSFRPVTSLDQRSSVLRKLVDALEQLQTGLVGHEMELHWVEQLLSYVYRLQTIPPAITVEEEFQHAYMLRKWFFWVPVTLLRRQSSKGPAILVLAHLYASVITLRSLFANMPLNFSSSFATTPNLVLPPLEAIIRMTDAMQTSQGHNAASYEIASLVQFARATMAEYCQEQTQGAGFVRDTSLDHLLQTGNISPAFTPAPVYQAPSLSSTAYLGIPAQPGFAYVTDNWGVVPSPGFPPLRQDSFGSYDSADDLYSVDHTGTTNMDYPSGNYTPRR